MKIPEYHPFVYLGHAHGIEVGVGKCTVVESFGGPVQERGIYPYIMADQQVGADKFDKPGEYLDQRRCFLQLLRSDPVDQGSLGMIRVFRPDIVVKGVAQIDLQSADPYRSNGDDLVFFAVQTGQFGIKDHVTVSRELSDVSKCRNRLLLEAISSSCLRNRANLLIKPRT